MDDDIGTPEAVAVLFELAHEIGRGRRELAPQLRALGGALGMLQREADAFLRGGEAGDWIAARSAARDAARKGKGVPVREDRGGQCLRNGPGSEHWSGE